MLAKRQFHRINILPINFKRWKTSNPKVSSTQKALDHFDDFYKPIFNKNWPSIRLGLLSSRKYVAAINNYSDVQSCVANLENLGAINLRRLFDFELSKQIENKTSSKPRRPKTEKLEETLTDISKRKLEEEHETIYQNEFTDSEKQASLNSTSDRYIDPSVGVSQLHEYVPATELKGSDDYVLESKHYSYYAADSDLDVTILKEDRLYFPDNLLLYSFEPGNVTAFPGPRRGTTGVSNYFLLDGGSAFPVFALDIQPNDKVLDMCAAPGGKSYLALQTLYPKTVVCNDVSASRNNRVMRLFNEFFYDYDKKMSSGEIKVTQEDARLIDAPGCYNKILVDVPCTTDRHSVMEDDNNIFKNSRLKERIRLPELQSQILASALKMVSVGGTVVYSTCSLSPIQNDGVVHMAIEKVSEETNSQIAAVDMSQALEPTKVICRYADIGLRYGHLIVPYIVNNFGPTYFCKLIKLR